MLYFYLRVFRHNRFKQQKRILCYLRDQKSSSRLISILCHNYTHLELSSLRKCFQSSSILILYCHVCYLVMKIFCSRSNRSIPISWQNHRAHSHTDQQQIFKYGTIVLGWHKKKCHLLLLS